MLKFTLLTILMLLGVYELINLEITPEDSGQSTLSAKNTDDAEILNFSYKMNILQYQKLLDPDRKTSLPDHKKIRFVPQNNKLWVQGSLNEAGVPFIEIEILGKSNRPWIQLDDKALHEGPEIKNIVLNGNKIQSFDARGVNLLDVEIQNSEHKELVDAILGKIDPKNEYDKFIQDPTLTGKNVSETETAIMLEYTTENKDISILFNKETGHVLLSKIISDREITTINYTYECINGKYVLVVQRTSIVKKDALPGEALTEFISLVRLEDISINY